MNRLRSIRLALVAVATAAGALAIAAGPRMFSTSPATVQRTSATVDDKGLGERLERAMWKAMADSDMDRVAAMIAPGFQSVHSDGARNRAEELSLISGLDLGPYTLSDFTVTRQGAAIVVCYFVDVGETIASERLATKAARSSVWVMTREGWQWVHHANLVPMQAPSLKAAPKDAPNSRNAPGR